MRISEICDTSMINLELNAESKMDAILKMADIIYSSGVIESKEDYIDGLMRREEEMSTGFGAGIAIPHCQSVVVKEARVAIARFTQPIEWDAIDGKPVDFAVMIAVPESQKSTVHLKILTTVASRLGSEDEVMKLKSFDTSEEIIQFLEN